MFKTLKNMLGYSENNPIIMKPLNYNGILYYYTYEEPDSAYPLTTFYKDGMCIGYIMMNIESHYNSKQDVRNAIDGMLSLSKRKIELLNNEIV